MAGDLVIVCHTNNACSLLCNFPHWSPNYWCALNEMYNALHYYISHLAVRYVGNHPRYLAPATDMRQTDAKQTMILRE